MRRPQRDGRHRVAQHAGGDGMALRVVAVQEDLRRRLLDHPGQLPSQIHGVLHTGVEALSANRGMHVRGVASQKAAVTLRFVHRIMHAPAEPDRTLSVMMGFGADTPLRDLAAAALWGNLTSLVTFTVLLGCAVLMRKRGDVHKRLMMLASLSILAPAIARISRWGLGGDMGPLVPTVMLLLLCAMVCYDFYSRRRVHWATVAGGGAVVLGIVAGSVVARSALGLWVVGRVG